MKKLTSLLVGLILIITSWNANAGSVDCVHVGALMKGFLTNHVTNRNYNKDIEKRFIDQYLKKLDSSKLYFLKEDITGIEKKMAGIFDQVREKRCEVIFETQNLYLKRVEERAEFAQKYLKGKFELNKNLEVTVDPKSRDYPASTEEASKYHEQYIQFQIANFLASGMNLNDAKGQVERRYKRSVKNLKDFSREDILATFLDSFANSLDPHSSYFSKDVLEDFEIQMRLSLEGIGATLSSQDGYTTIEHLIPGGAAARSGQIEVQDKIIAVGQGDKGGMESVIDESLRDVVRKIRGKKGTQVRLTILRKGEKNSTFNVTLVRDKINLEDEAAQVTYIDKVIDGKKRTVAILDLPSFYSANKKGGRSASGDMKKLLKELKEKKAAGLVLDLSSNGGGSLEDAVKIAGLFFKTGAVVETQGNGERVEALADEDSSVDYSGPLVVLTSRLSASASEIVAGALKDYKRGVVVGGDHTFGKGTVQTVIPLPDELGALKVTVGMFFIPGGNSTQHRGVDADIALPGAYSTDDIGEKSLDYSLPPKSLKPFLSADAYVPQGPDAWLPVNKEIIDRLKASSEKRVSANADFQKILKDLKKAQDEKAKPIKISEVLKDKETAKKREEKKKYSAEARRKEYLKRADVQESLNVLAELVAETDRAQMKLVSSPPAKTDQAGKPQ